ncbi:MAG: FAD-binding protein [Bacteroidia bacterium]|nr:FAD-binding protein [Bacteroidia bacterium]
MAALTCTITIPPERVGEKEEIGKRAARKLGISPSRITFIRLVRRSVDARKTPPMFVLQLEVWADEEYSPPSFPEFPLKDVSGAPEIHIAGTGPAGLFAALQLIASGCKPILIERGKEVRERRRDLAKITREGIVNPDSNYCFGEGGAGTFSDGKLYTRSTKRGDTRQVLETLVAFGATEEILIETHPHIGTNKLPAIIQNMREKIIACGGEVWFESRLTGWEISSGKISAIQLNEREKIPVKALILATGHSARDIFRLFPQTRLSIEAKPFALGVRVEHPQEIIDRIQYHCPSERQINLPAASYSLVQQIGGRGVYSFCMCPGGIICPAATISNEIVVNGWSPSKRNSPFANSGIVVEVGLDDYQAPDLNPLAGMLFQASVEEKAFIAGGGKQVAPAQRLTDFVAGKVSQSLPECSYLPGITAVSLSEVLPSFVAERLVGGFQAFGRKMKGYLTEEAVVVGVESRTSSPVKIPRNPDTLMHPEAEGLFPCGEGAGYAGGIMSAAIDGKKCAEAVVALFQKKSV